MLTLISDIMSRGGPVMWPLLALSLIGVTLSVERILMFASLNRAARRQRVRDVARAWRQGDVAPARSLAKDDRTPFGTLTADLLASAKLTPGAADEALNEARPRLERFLPVLSTIITGAPMLGILGTVLGIIGAFDELAANQSAAGSARPDMARVGAAIAEALITTAAGIVVALVILLPYNLLRVQSRRAMRRLEDLADAGLEAEKE